MIKPYYETSLGKLYHGESLEVLKTFPDNYVESIITDPPYALVGASRNGSSQPGDLTTPFGRSGPSKKRGFMGKEWDGQLPGIEVWKEVLRIAKPGATLLCFGGDRTHHRLMVNIEDAGWVIKTCIYWIFGSGFPKSLSIGKSIDKSQGNDREIIGEKIRGDVQKAKEKGSGYLADPANRNNIKQFGYGIEKLTKGTSGWDGWGTALKPAAEIIVVAMKPNEGSYAQNALKWGVAGLNIDGSRIETNPEVDDMDRQVVRKQRETQTWEKGSGFKNETNSRTGVLPEGRYPANIILDEEAGRLMDEQSGELKSGSMKKPYKYTNNGYSLGAPTGETKQIHESNVGGASRFFYCAKASKSERNRGCEGLEEKNIAYQDYRENVDGTKSFVSCYPDGSPRPMNKPKNNHPTVKPLKLMEYLCNLVKTPTGGIILDPFSGSGTTAIACERLNRRWIMIEKELKYIEIAANRIEAENRQLKLFR